MEDKRKFIFACLVTLIILITSCGTDSEKEITPPKPLYIATIMHLEKALVDEDRTWWDYTDKNYYDLHVEYLLAAANLYEEHGAKMTVEASISIAENIPYYNFNVLEELQSRGHGIGAHMDLGVDVQRSNNFWEIVPDLLQGELSSEIDAQKVALDSILSESIIHNSGTPSPLDWVQANLDAGFQCHTSAVSYYLASLNEEYRPSGWTDQYILDGHYHTTYPFTFNERINPWSIESSENWIVPSNGDFIYIPGESGVPLDYLDEFYNQGITDHGALLSDAEFTQEDVDQAIKMIEEALTYSDPNKVNSYYFMVLMHTIKADEENDFILLKDFFERINVYVESGQIEWKTIPEICLEYQEWKDNQ
jgi:hypothetical protein